MDALSLLDSPASGNSGNTSKEFNILELKSKIAELQNQLLTEHPAMPMLLRDIHKQIQRDPELVTIISEEEIGIIVNGLKKQTNTELITQTVKASKSAATKKALGKVTLDDL